QTIEDFVRGNELLSDLVKKCGGRCHVVDNKHCKNNQQDEYRNNQFQVKELLKTIDKISEANKGSCYTNEMLQAEAEGAVEAEAGAETLAKTPNPKSSCAISVADLDMGEETSSNFAPPLRSGAPGPHAFLIVLKVERFTEHEQAVITKINQYFSEEVLKYATVLFTHGDQLEEGQTIEDFVRGNELLSDLVKKCGGRCHVVDNKYWKNNQQDEYRNNQFQVKELLKTMDKITEANGGSYYTHEMLQAVEEKIKQEVELIRKSPGNMSEIDIREKAKDRANERLLIKLAGITTGALLGAVFGAEAEGAVEAEAGAETLAKTPNPKSSCAISVADLDMGEETAHNPHGTTASSTKTSTIIIM
ncbi:uncharacterized protein LOC129116237, partial [Anoplopoma fimbria]|uniref:uncharacterized protein LOC129116237 n=1 Tax=Anoplopoma fimbria TaxID=229290 RepID=UPI0023EBF921